MTRGLELACLGILCAVSPLCPSRPQAWGRRSQVSCQELGCPRGKQTLAEDTVMCRLHGSSQTSILMSAQPLPSAALPLTWKDPFYACFGGAKVTLRVTMSQSSPRGTWHWESEWSWLRKTLYCIRGVPNARGRELEGQDSWGEGSELALPSQGVKGGADPGLHVLCLRGFGS